MSPLHVLLSSPLCDPPLSEPAAMLDRAESLADQPSVWRAALSGWAADRLGVAFVGGYASALSRLAPGLSARTALSATESGGAHPRAIATKLEESGAGHAVTGKKTFTTLAPFAERLLVVASEGMQDTRNRLRVAVVRRDAPGVVVEPRAPTPFAPEVPHAVVTFDRAPCERVLPGDGYDLYLKPFRTIEDVHVLAAAAGYLVRLARSRGWPDEIAERAAALLTTLAAIADAPPLAPATHVALGGAFTIANDAIERASACWTERSDAQDDERIRWERDRPLLLVAQTARSARLAAAWLALRGGKEHD